MLCVSYCVIHNSHASLDVSYNPAKWVRLESLDMSCPIMINVCPVPV